MSAFIRLFDAELAIGDEKLLDNAAFQIDEGERVCLVGRNGAGKSTLMKILRGETALDSGQLISQREIKIGCLEQDPPKGQSGDVFDYVAAGLKDIGNLLQDYHRQTQLIASSSEQADLDKLHSLQSKIDSQDGWKFEQCINQVLSRLNLTADMRLENLSGGWLRKVALAKALVNEPDVLMLDEPTNHLDIAVIQWLEEFLNSYKGSIIFISHDRAFIRKLATRIVDLDRGVLTSFPGNYDTYLQQKAENLRVEEEQNALFDKKLAEEETWIRQGIKARRTRNEGRVRALKELRQQRAKRRDSQGKATLSLDATSQSGKVVFDVKNISYQWQDKVIVEEFSALVMRSDKIALVGPNGCGKTTLLKLLIGELTAQSGSVKQGVNSEIAYFDQYREQLDENKSVQDNVSEGKTEVMVGGKSRHIIGYLQDFLFMPKRARTPLRALSGGEKNRVLLAKLFLKPSNLLILDEPTNDLDIETLELLEDLIANDSRTVLLVSHDREFVNNTVDSVWYFDGAGKVIDIVGGYDDAVSWANSKQSSAKDSEEKNETKSVGSNQNSLDTTAGNKKKLSYKLKLELQALPEKIDQLESQLAEIQQQINQPDFFKREQSDVKATLQQSADLEQQLEKTFERWNELEELNS